MAENQKQKSFFERLTSSSKKEEQKPRFVEPAEGKRVDFAAPSVQAQQSQESGAEWIEEGQEGQLTVDVYQTPTDIFIRSTVAGVKPEDLDIAITNDMVTIRGKRSLEEQIKPDQYIYQECYWGPFSRSIILPTDVAADKAEAALQNGILTIKLPKAAKEQTKTIKVKSVP